MMTSQHMAATQLLSVMFRVIDRSQGYTAQMSSSMCPEACGLRVGLG